MEAKIKELEEEVARLKRINQQLDQKCKDTYTRLQQRNNQITNIKKVISGCQRCHAIQYKSLSASVSPSAPGRACSNINIRQTSRGGCVKKRRVKAELLEKYPDTGTPPHTIDNKDGEGGAFTEYLQLFTDSGSVWGMSPRPGQNEPGENTNKIDKPQEAKIINPTVTKLEHLSEGNNPVVLPASSGNDLVCQRTNVLNTTNSLLEKESELDLAEVEKKTGSNKCELNVLNESDVETKKESETESTTTAYEKSHNLESGESTENNPSEKEANLPTESEKEICVPKDDENMCQNKKTDSDVPKETLSCEKESKIENNESKRKSEKEQKSNRSSPSLKEQKHFHKHPSGSDVEVEKTVFDAKTGVWQTCKQTVKKDKSHHDHSKSHEKHHDKGRTRDKHEKDTSKSHEKHHDKGRTRDEHEKDTSKSHEKHHDKGRTRDKHEKGTSKSTCKDEKSSSRHKKRVSDEKHKDALKDSRTKVKHVKPQEDMKDRSKKKTDKENTEHVPRLEKSLEVGQKSQQVNSKASGSNTQDNEKHLIAEVLKKDCSVDMCTESRSECKNSALRAPNKDKKESENYKPGKISRSRSSDSTSERKGKNASCKASDKAEEIPPSSDKKLSNGIDEKDRSRGKLKMTKVTNEKVQLNDSETNDIKGHQIASDEEMVMDVEEEPVLCHDLSFQEDTLVIAEDIPEMKECNTDTKKTLENKTDDQPDRRRKKIVKENKDLEENARLKEPEEEDQTCVGKPSTPELVSVSESNPRILSPIEDLRSQLPLCFSPSKKSWDLDEEYQHEKEKSAHRESFSRSKRKRDSEGSSKLSRKSKSEGKSIKSKVSSGQMAQALPFASKSLANFRIPKISKPAEKKGTKLVKERTADEEKQHNSGESDQSSEKVIKKELISGEVGHNAEKEFKKEHNSSERDHNSEKVLKKEHISGERDHNAGKELKREPNFDERDHKPEKEISNDSVKKAQISLFTDPESTKVPLKTLSLPVPGQPSQVPKALLPSSEMHGFRPAVPSLMSLNIKTPTKFSQTKTSSLVPEPPQPLVSMAIPGDHFHSVPPLFKLPPALPPLPVTLTQLPPQTIADPVASAVHLPLLRSKPVEIPLATPLGPAAPRDPRKPKHRDPRLDSLILLNRDQFQPTEPQQPTLSVPHPATLPQPLLGLLNTASAPAQTCQPPQDLPAGEANTGLPNVLLSLINEVPPTQVKAQPALPLPNVLMNLVQSVKVPLSTASSEVEPTVSSKIVINGTEPSSSHNLTYTSVESPPPKITSQCDIEPLHQSNQNQAEDVPRTYKEHKAQVMGNNENIHSYPGRLREAAENASSIASLPKEAKSKKLAPHLPSVPVRTCYPVKAERVRNFANDEEQLLAYLNLNKSRSRSMLRNHKSNLKVEKRRLGAVPPSSHGALADENLYGGREDNEEEEELEVEQQHGQLSPKTLEELWNQGVDIHDPDVIEMYMKMAALGTPVRRAFPDQTEGYNNDWCEDAMVYNQNFNEDENDYDDDEDEDLDESEEDDIEEMPSKRSRLDDCALKGEQCSKMDDHHDGESVDKWTENRHHGTSGEEQMDVKNSDSSDANLTQSCETSKTPLKIEPQEEQPIEKGRNAAPVNERKIQEITNDEKDLELDGPKKEVDSQKGTVDQSGEDTCSQKLAVGGCEKKGEDEEEEAEEDGEKEEEEEEEEEEEVNLKLEVSPGYKSGSSPLRSNHENIKGNLQLNKTTSGQESEMDDTDEALHENVKKVQFDLFGQESNASDVNGVESSKSKSEIEENDVQSLYQLRKQIQLELFGEDSITTMDTIIYDPNFKNKNKVEVVEAQESVALKGKEQGLSNASNPSHGSTEYSGQGVVQGHTKTDSNCDGHFSTVSDQEEASHPFGSQLTESERLELQVVSDGDASSYFNVNDSRYLSDDSETNDVTLTPVKIESQNTDVERGSETSNPCIESRVNRPKGSDSDLDVDVGECEFYIDPASVVVEIEADEEEEGEEESESLTDSETTSTDDVHDDTSVRQSDGSLYSQQDQDKTQGKVISESQKVSIKGDEESNSVKLSRKDMGDDGSSGKSDSTAVVHQKEEQGRKESYSTSKVDASDNVSKEEEGCNKSLLKGTRLKRTKTSGGAKVEPIVPDILCYDEDSLFDSEFILSPVKKSPAKPPRPQVKSGLSEKNGAQKSTGSSESGEFKDIKSVSPALRERLGNRFEKRPRSPSPNRKEKRPRRLSMDYSSHDPRTPSPESQRLGYRSRSCRGRSEQKSQARHWSPLSGRMERGRDSNDHVSPSHSAHRCSTPSLPMSRARRRTEHIDRRRR